MDQEFRIGLLGVSGSGSFMKLQQNFEPGLWSFEGLTEAERSGFQEWSHDYWLEASVPYHMGLFIGLFEFPRDRSWLSRNQVIQERKSKQEIAVPFMNSSLGWHSVISALFSIC